MEELKEDATECTTDLVMDLAPSQLVPKGRPFDSLFTEDNLELFEQRDRELQVTNKSGESLHVLLAHGSNIIIGLNNGEIKIFSAVDLHCKQVLSHSKLVSQVTCFQATSTEVIAGYRDASMCIWNIQSGNLTRRFCAGNRASDSGYARVVRLQGTKLAVLTVDGKVGIWNYENSLIKFISGWKSGASPVRLEISGNHVLLMGCYGPVGVYSFDGALVHNIGNPGEVRDMGIYKDYAIVGNKNCTVQLWDINAGKCLMELDGHGSEVDSVIVHNNYLLTADIRGSVVVWSIEAALEGRPAALVKISDAGGAPTYWRAFHQYSLGQNLFVRKSKNSSGVIKVTDFL